MTLLTKARKNRLTALAVKVELARRKAAAAQEQAALFRSRRGSDNLNWAPQPLQRSA